MFGRFFGRKRNDEAGAARLREVTAAFRAGIIADAEKKIGRALTDEEKAGIERISSLMMLESLDRTFSAEATTAEQALSTIGHFASLKDPD